jgi:hypothetical protein
MTPEELEALQGISAEHIESIRDAVIAYYAQYDEAGAAVGQDQPVEDMLPEGEAYYEAVEPDAESEPAVEELEATPEDEQIVLETESPEEITAEPELQEGEDPSDPEKQVEEENPESAKLGDAV